MQVEGAARQMVVTVQQGATLQAYNGVRLEAGGVLQLQGGRVTTIGEVDIRAGGGIIGSGTIDGFQSLLAGIPEFAGKKFLQPKVVNAGVIDLQGTGPAGSLTINGDFVQSSSGMMFVDVVGPSSVDSMTVSGDATFGGNIEVDLIGSYTPAMGAMFTLLTADSLSLKGLSLAGADSSLFSPIVTSTTLSLVYTAGQFVADFDFNGVVNVADLAVWRQNAGQSTFAGDANRDGIVDGSDFMIWQRQIGSVLSPAVWASAAVPEPAAAALGLGALGALVSANRKRRPLSC